MLMPSSVCSRSDDEMVPHQPDLSSWSAAMLSAVSREQEPLVTGVALYADDAVADAPLDPGGGNLQGLRHP